MIDVQPLDSDTIRRALQARGGFLWWYLDVVGEGGDGVVLIWSFGLPFLPGYAESARSGDAPPARRRPSLNLAVYRDWELDCYLLQEYEPDDVHYSPERDAWAFGGTRLRVSEVASGSRLVAELDCAVPGADARITGRVVAEGITPSTDAAHGDANESPHRWMPRLVPAHGRADLQFGETDGYRFEGRAYHDANASTAPLQELGIGRWIWGRAPLGERELIYYGLRSDEESDEAPEQFAVELGRDGGLHSRIPIEIELDDPRRNLGGMRWWRHAVIRAPGGEFPDLEVTHRSAVDSGPFYMRFLTELRAGDERAGGVAELIRPRRVDLARHRPFVRMRVHRKQGGNSMWLPLFTGPRRGRLRRLLRHNIGGGAP